MRRTTGTPRTSFRRKQDGSVHFCELPQTSNSQLPKLPPNTKLRTRLKRYFQKMLIASEKHPLTGSCFRSNAALVFEKKRHSRSEFWWIVHPFSSFRFAWDCMMTLVYLYLFVTSPYMIAFQRLSFRNNSPDILTPAYVLRLLDVALNFMTGYVFLDGTEVCLDPVLIVRHYFQGYFLLDLTSSLPYTWFYPVDLEAPESEGNFIPVLLELLPLLILSRLRTLSDNIRHINIALGVPRTCDILIWFGLLTSLIFHWCACCTYALPFLLLYAYKKPIETSKALVIQFKNEPHWKIYLMSFHIGASNFCTASYDEFTPTARSDVVLKCVLSLLGMGYAIFLIVRLLQLVDSRVTPELKYQETMHNVQEYIRDNHLPEQLAVKLINYYQYRFRGSYFKENAILNSLSALLRQEIMIHGSRGLLEKATIFHNLPRSLLANLISALKPAIYLRDDVIMKCDTDGDCMFFIASGTVALVTCSGEEVCHVEDGDYFGESALIYEDRRRDTSAIALETCELLYLQRRSFKRLASVESEFYNRLEKAAKERTDKVREIEGQRETRDEEVEVDPADASGS